MGFSQSAIGPLSDSILTKPLNFILLGHLLNKNIFHNCVEEMKDCAGPGGGRAVRLPRSRSAAD